MKEIPTLRTTSDRHLSAVLLEGERIEAERLLNGVRAIVLLMMAGAAVMYAPALTPALWWVNVGVLVPMLAWTAAQYIWIHRPRRSFSWLTLI